LPGRWGLYQRCCCGPVLVDSDNLLRLAGFCRLLLGLVQRLFLL
jgi:hypothetical protein